MSRFTDFLVAFRTLLLRVVEVLGLIVALIVLVYLLLGEDSGPFVIKVVSNLIVLITAVSPQTLVAVALVIGFAMIYRSRSRRD